LLCRVFNVVDFFLINHNNSLSEGQQHGVLIHEVVRGSENIRKHRETEVLAFKNVPYSHTNALHFNNKAEKNEQKNISSQMFCWH